VVVTREGTPSPQVLGLIASLVEERVGLHYRLPERDLFADKLVTRAQDAGFETLLDYYYALRYDDPTGEEVRRLVEALVVHETYLFRELHSLEVVVDRLLLPIIAAGGRPRIWSAACATGEEPLSIAILLAERGVLGSCEIVATDISERALARAMGGRYRPRSLRNEGRALAERWLQCSEEGVVVPRPLLDAIEFRQLNLCDDQAVAAMGTFDVVLCRYVLIYFAEPTVAKVVAALTDRIRVGGALVVGVSESLLRFSTRVRGEELEGAFVYRRQS
jgi:chemotaxis protein methyltransferase CheR